MSHYLLETSRVVFQVGVTLLSTPSQLPEWERGRAVALGTAPLIQSCSPRPRLSGASMFFMSCWQGWTPRRGSSSPFRNRRPTTTSTRWGMPSWCRRGSCPDKGLRPGVPEEPDGGGCGGPGPAPQPHCALQGRACRLQDKKDARDFAGLATALQMLGLCPEELTTIWALLATILHLGNICFSSSEVGSPWGQGQWGLRVSHGCLHDRGGENVGEPWCVGDYAAPESGQIPMCR